MSDFNTVELLASVRDNLRALDEILDPRALTFSEIQLAGSGADPAARYLLDMLIKANPSLNYMEVGACLDCMLMWINSYVFLRDGGDLQSLGTWHQPIKSDPVIMHIAHAELRRVAMHLGFDIDDKVTNYMDLDMVTAMKTVLKQEAFWLEFLIRVYVQGGVLEVEGIEDD